MPVLNQEGKVIAIVTVINRKRDKIDQSNDGTFGQEDYKTMAGVCAQVRMKDHAVSHQRIE